MRKTGFLFVRTRYQLKVLNEDGSRRAEHIHFEQAAARALRSLRADILTDIPKELGGYLDRLASADQ